MTPADPGVLAIPGLVDLQVNGYAGVDYSSETLDEDALADSWHALMARGTAAFLPTLITSPEAIYARNLPLIARVMARHAFHGHVLGIHLEGPFISAEPGAVGAHDPRYVRAPDLALLGRLLNWGQGRVRLLTLAAELPGAADVAAEARARDVTVSIGHSLFTGDHLRRLHAAGARALTHLGNGLPNLLPRHPNPIWEGLAHDGYAALLIADGHHLPEAVLRVMVRALAVERVVIVSDAAPVAGLPPGDYDVLGNRATLYPSGLLYNSEKQCLVGSTATMLDCLNHLAVLGLYDLGGLLAVGVTNPLRLIGVSLAQVAPIPGIAIAFRAGRLALIRHGSDSAE